MESTTEPLSPEMAKPSINIIDIIILGGLLTLGAYWLLFRKKKPEFDASSIKTFSIE